MGQAVHQPLAGAPVVAFGPILGKFTNLGSIGTLTPIVVGEILRSAGGGKRMSEIIEHRLRHIDCKWFDHRPSPS
jgi:hypothetical protein